VTKLVCDQTSGALSPPRKKYLFSTAADMMITSSISSYVQHLEQQTTRSYKRPIGSQADLRSLMSGSEKHERHKSRTSQGAKGKHVAPDRHQQEPLHVDVRERAARSTDERSLSNGKTPTQCIGSGKTDHKGPCSMVSA
jgi:hypothetical protein